MKCVNHLFLFLLCSLSIDCMQQNIALCHYPICMPKNDPELSEVRKVLDGISTWQEIITAVPTIKAQPLSMMERPGVCYDYAMKSILSKYGINKKFETPGCQQWAVLLPSFFKQVQNIKKDDLALYFWQHKQQPPEHLGLIVDPNLLTIRSKWGTIKAVFEHNIFELPAMWGNAVSFFRLKKEYRTPGQYQKHFVQTIRTLLVNDVLMKQVLQLITDKFWRLVKCSPKKSAEKKEKIITLLEQTAVISVDSQNELGRTPLMAAVILDDFVIVELLLQYGADVTIEDIDGKTAYIFAQKRNNIAMQQLLQSYTS